MKCSKETMLLYGVTDRAWVGRQTLYEQVECALKGGATCIQLREKDLDEGNFLKEAMELKALCKKYQVPFIINDNVEIAIACQADGIHVGQSDMKAFDVRSRVGENMMIGVSAQTVEQAAGETPAVDTIPETASGQPPDTGTWWDDIKYFRRSDPYIGCPCGKCGGFPVEPSEKLMRLADRVREHFGVPMIPTSTVRCQAHNDSLKGSAKNSYHVRGKAMDFYFEHIPAATVLAYVQTQGVHYAYAIDGSAVHMDVS